MQLQDVRFSKKDKRALAASSNDINRIKVEGQLTKYANATRGEIYIEPNLENTSVVPNLISTFNNTTKVIEKNYIQINSVTQDNSSLVPNNTFEENTTEITVSNYDDIPLVVVKLTDTTFNADLDYTGVVIANNKIYWLVNTKKIKVINQSNTNSTKTITVNTYSSKNSNYSKFAANSSGTPKSEVLYIDSSTGNTYSYINGVITNDASNFSSSNKKELPTLTLSDFPDANTDYIIAYDFAWDVVGNLPKDIKLIFDGGSIYFGNKNIPKVPMKNPKVITTIKRSTTTAVINKLSPGSVLTVGSNGSNYITVDISNYIDIETDYIAMNGTNFFGINLSNVFDRIKASFFDDTSIQPLQIKIPNGKYCFTRPFDMPNRWSVDFDWSTVYIYPQTWEGGSYVISIITRESKRTAHYITKCNFYLAGFSYGKTNGEIDEEKIGNLSGTQLTKAKELKTLFLGNIQNCYMQDVYALYNDDYKMYFIFQQWGDAYISYNDAKDFFNVNVNNCSDPDFYRTVLILGDANVFTSSYALGGTAIIGGRTNLITGSLNGKWLFVNTMISYIANYHEIGNIKCAGAKVNFINCQLEFDNRYTKNEGNNKSAIEADTENVYKVIDKIAEETQTLSGVNYVLPSRADIGLAYSELTFTNCDFNSSLWTLGSPNVDSFLKTGQYTKVFGLDDNCNYSVSGMTGSNSYTEYPNYQGRVCPNDKLPNNIFSTDLTNLSITSTAARITYFKYRVGSSNSNYEATTSGAIWGDNDTMDFKVFICFDKNRRLFYNQPITSGSHIQLRDQGDTDSTGEYYLLPGVKVLCDNGGKELPERIMGTLLVNWHTSSGDQKVIFESAKLKRYGGLRLKNQNINITEDKRKTRILPKNPNNKSTIIEFSNICQKYDENQQLTCLTSSTCVGYKDNDYYNELDNAYFNPCLKIEKISDDNLRAYLNELPTYGQWNEGDEVVVKEVIYKYYNESWNNIYNPLDKRKFIYSDAVENSIQLESGAVNADLNTSSIRFIKPSENNITIPKINSNRVEIQVNLNNTNIQLTNAAWFYYYIKDGVLVREPTIYTSGNITNNKLVITNAPSVITVDGIDYTNIYLYASFISADNVAISPDNYYVLFSQCAGLDPGELQWRSVSTPYKVSSNTLIDDYLKVEGFEYYDTTLKKKVLWNGTDWVNVDGTPLTNS